MAKRGLGGAGVNALFPKRNLNVQSNPGVPVVSLNENRTEPKIETPSFEMVAESKSDNAAETSVKTSIERKLPAGISVDENGQLLADVNLLVPNPHQPREEFDEEKLGELADSIKEHGILQAITIEDAGDGKFYIIAGERRTRAAKIAGLEKVPVQLRKFDEQKKLEIALIENIQRADLNDVEEAKAYYKLMQISGLSQDQIAARVGKNRSTVANAIRLLKLPEDMQTALAEKRLTSGHARALLAVKEPTNQRILFTKIIDSGMNVRDAEKMATDLNEGRGKTDSSSKNPQIHSRDPNLVEIEQKFIEAFGTKVVINGSLEKGKIEIEYFSKSDLDRLYNLISKDE